MTVHIVTVLAESLEQVAALRTMKFDLHERAARRRAPDGGYAVPAILTDEQIERLRAQDYRVVVQEDAEQLTVERSADVRPEVDRFAPSPPEPAGPGPAARRDRAPQSDRASDAGVRLERLMDLADLDERSAHSDGLRDHGDRAVLGGYLTSAEVESAQQVLADNHPAVASITPPPEPSWEGATSHVLRLRAGTRQQRTGALVTGGVHAREWGGSDICVAFATNLLRAYETGDPLRYGGKTFSATDVRSILEKLDVFVFADVNPDGKAYSQSVDPDRPQNFWWRKNRREQGLPNGAVGVDVNRNFDFLWASGIGTVTDPQEFVYRGPSAFSEPESRNVRELFDRHPDIGYFVDVHSFGELVLCSWGDDENQVDTPEQTFLNPDGMRGVVGDSIYKEYIPPADRASMTDLATGMRDAIHEVRGRSYTVDQAVGLYPTAATSDDYSFSRHRSDPTRRKVYGFTIEFGEQFVPPYAEMRQVMADVAAALTELCRRAAHAEQGGPSSSTNDPSHNPSSRRAP